MILVMGSRFICEIIALIIFGFWGYEQWKGFGAIVVPLVVVVIWAMCGSPNAPYKLQSYYGFILEVFLFSTASYALFSLGYPYFALMYGIVALGIAILIHLT